VAGTKLDICVHRNLLWPFTVLCEQQSGYFVAFPVVHV